MLYCKEILSALGYFTKAADRLRKIIFLNLSDQNNKRNTAFFSYHLAVTFSIILVRFSSWDEFPIIISNSPGSTAYPKSILVKDKCSGVMSMCSKVFQRGDNMTFVFKRRIFLKSFYRCYAHLRHYIGIFAKGFFNPPPSWVPADIQYQRESLMCASHSNICCRGCINFFDKFRMKGRSQTSRLRIAGHHFGRQNVQTLFVKYVGIPKRVSVMKYFCSSLAIVAISTGRIPSSVCLCAQSVRSYGAGGSLSDLN